MGITEHEEVLLEVFSFYCFCWAPLYPSTKLWTPHAKILFLELLEECKAFHAGSQIVQHLSWIPSI